MVFRRRRE